MNNQHREKNVILLRRTLLGRLEPLAKGYTAPSGSSSQSLRTLAELRGAPIDRPGTVPAIWEITLGELPEELSGRGDDPNSAEYAIHAALVLFARHQQSHRDLSMHQPGLTFGSAIQRLAWAREKDGSPSDSVLRKMHYLARATTWESTCTGLRGLISMLSAENIPLDYGHLVTDLYQIKNLANNPKAARGVHLRWARDAYKTKTESTNDNN